jgi:hypothetical protein
MSLLEVTVVDTYQILANAVLLHKYIYGTLMVPFLLITVTHPLYITVLVPCLSVEGPT